MQTRLPFPVWLPDAVTLLTEDASIHLAGAIQQTNVPVPDAERPVPTCYVRQGEGEAPLLLIHGFDSSLLEFRRLLPQLAHWRETWAMDLLGFGFTDRLCCPALNPDTIKHHLYQFWQQQIARPVVLVGASMGGAAAIDFAISYPDCVERLILLDSVGFEGGSPISKLMFPPFDGWATAFLASPQVRRRISQQAYCDRTLVTPDADVCASLHVAMPGWKEALIQFTKSGGYTRLQDKIAAIRQPTLIIWGDQDRILGTAPAYKFARYLADHRLVWISHCGHVPHLEKPVETAQAIEAFL